MNIDDHQITQPELTNKSTDNTAENAIILENSTPTSEPIKSTFTSVEGEKEENTPEPERIKVHATISNLESKLKELTAQIKSLKQQKQGLTQEIKRLQDRKHKMMTEKIQDIEQHIRLMVEEGFKELKQQKQALEISVEQLERRRDRIKEEMRTTFAGVSQDLAIRVQGFKDYLVGSLQDLAAAAEQLELPTQETWSSSSETIPSQCSSSEQVQFASQEFEGQTTTIKRILEQYRKNPDYYGVPWQLRRTFEAIHAERVQTWFFSQGGRGAIRSMGTRLQNILIASAIISVLNSLHGDRSRFLILANSPERLGEWRRGLQDCLGISRSDFGPERGVILFESPDVLVLKAERLLEDEQIPLVVIDETEEQVNLSLLQFPLWLAFAPDLQQMSSYLY